MADVPVASDVVIARFDSLSTRGQEVFAALATSMLERQVAEALGISRNTVHGYVKHIYGVMQIHSRRELIALAKHDPRFFHRAETIARSIKPRHKPVIAPDDTGEVEITVRIDRQVLAALGRHINNLPKHLADLARREADRLSIESERTT